MNGADVDMVPVLRNGTELEVDGPGVNYNFDDSDDGIDERKCGAPRAILKCRKNALPFRQRVLNLEQPVKIGRSVARTRPSLNNGIFDCKVLSRNHAVMWYENEKFYIQDTKSSNGTFVNSQRLSRGAEDSLPREIWSGDVLQFGVDVLENQRKGNEESENSDEVVHIVTHGCIVATVKLIYPNGREAKPCTTNNTQSSVTSYSQEDISKLQLIIFEAQQREERLHAKLEELHSIISVLQDSCHDTLNVRFAETRLLSKIENHEKRTKVMNKIKPGSMEGSEIDIVYQLLSDVEKVQYVSQEIQERLHRQLLESEQNLTVAKMDASNLQQEVQSLRDLASRSENSIQEIATKCSNYVTTIESLEARLNTQLKNNMDLECRIEGIQKQEAEFKKFLTQPLSQVPEKLIADEWDDDLPPKKEMNPVVLEWYAKCYPILKDRVNEEDSWKLIRRFLESTFSDLEKANNEFEKLSTQKQNLLRKLETLHCPTDTPDKTDNLESDKDSESEMGDSCGNESVALLESELKETEESLIEAAFKKKILENRCSTIKVDLELALNSCDKPEKVNCDESENIVDHIRRMAEAFESRHRGMTEHEPKISQTLDGATQTEDKPLENKETLTDSRAAEDIPAIQFDGNMTIRRNRSKDIKQYLAPSVKEEQDDEKPSIDELDEVLAGLPLNDDDSEETRSASPVSEPILSPAIKNAVSDARDASRRLENLLQATEHHPQSQGIWDNVKKIHDACNTAITSEPRTKERLDEIKELLNLVSEDLVALLVRERQLATEHEDLQNKLNQSMSQADVAALSLADRFLALVIGLVICYIGGKFLEYLGAEF